MSALSQTTVAMFARPDRRLPSEAGLTGAFTQLRQDLDYLGWLVDNDTRKTQ